VREGRREEKRRGEERRGEEGFFVFGVEEEVRVWDGLRDFPTPQFIVK